MGDAGGIVVRSGGQHEVVAVALIDAHRHDGWVKNDGEEFVAETLQRLSFGEGELRGVHLLQRLAELLGSEGWLEFLAAVVVVNAGREPHAFEVFGDSGEEGGVAVSLVGRIDRFEHLADAEIVASVLVEQNVASGKGGFLEIIDEGLLAQRQLVKAFDAVAQHLNVGELLVGVAEVVLRFVCRSGERSQTKRSGHHHGGDSFLHIIIRYKIVKRVCAESLCSGKVGAKRAERFALFEGWDG